MRRFRKSIKGFGKVALAAWLVATILLMTVVAPCASWHQRLHGDDRGASDSCVLCMMAQGHLDCPAAPPVDVSFVSLFVGLTPIATQAGLRQVDWRLAPSRAPPFC